jgi:hypothetical protein
VALAGGVKITYHFDTTTTFCRTETVKSTSLNARFDWHARRTYRTPQLIYNS